MHVRVRFLHAMCRTEDLSAPRRSLTHIDSAIGAAMSDILGEDEYERRFLVEDRAVLEGVTDYEEIDQAYLWAAGGYAVRVRGIWQSGDSVESTQCFLTLKGPRKDAHRYEVETPISADHARQIVKLARTGIQKKRYGVISEGNTWIIDVFEGNNEGLIVAEFEASKGAVETLKKPWWAGAEVTNDSRYNNEELAVTPWPFQELP
jgi:adenylate cyclase